MTKREEIEGQIKAKRTAINDLLKGIESLNNQLENTPQSELDRDKDEEQRLRFERLNDFLKAQGLL